MKKVLTLLLSIVLLAGFAVPYASVALAAPAQAAQSQEAGKTYHVLVGWEDMKHGIEVNAFFPSKLHIHMGDTVNWKANTMEIHTVTFLAGNPLPDFIVPAPAGQISPLMLNPLAAFPTPLPGGLYDGSTYLNSGIISTDPGQVASFSLTFTKAGTYPYVCIVHGVSMAGTITVEDPSKDIPSPSNMSGQTQQLIADQGALIQATIRSAQAQMQRPIPNPDGSFTFHVLVGFSFGIVDIHQFFPSRIHVAPGDKVVFSLSKSDMAPHTVTFLNGGPSPDNFIVVDQPNALPLILLNPEVLFPAKPGVPLTDQGYFNSGLMVPGSPNTSFAFTIGDVTGVLPFECLLHDQMGMNGTLVVTPRKVRPPHSDGPVLGPNGDPLLFIPLVQ